jgi:hypothetical protein
MPNMVKSMPKCLTFQKLYWHHFIAGQYVNIKIFVEEKRRAENGSALCESESHSTYF